MTVAELQGKIALAIARRGAQWASKAQVYLNLNGPNGTLATFAEESLNTGTGIYDVFLIESEN